MVDHEKVWHIFITSWIKSNFDQQILSALGLNQCIGNGVDVVKLMKLKHVKKNKNLLLKLQGERVISDDFLDYFSLALVSKQLYRALFLSDDSRMIKMLGIFLHHQYRLQTAFELEAMLDNLFHFNECCSFSFDGLCIQKKSAKTMRQKKLGDFITGEHVCDKPTIALIRCKSLVIMLLVLLTFFLMLHSLGLMNEDSVIPSLVMIIVTMLSCCFTCVCCSVIDCNPTVRRMERRLLDHSQAIILQGLESELNGVSLVGSVSKVRSRFMLLLENLLNVDKPIQPSAETGNPKEAEHVLALSAPTY